jgi:hypothetical protein
MVGDVGPVAQPICLATINEQELLVSSPIFAEDRISMLFDYPIVMPGFVLLGLCPGAEAGATKVKVLAAAGAAYAHGQGNVSFAYVAVVLDAGLCSCRRYMATGQNIVSQAFHWVDQ